MPLTPALWGRRQEDCLKFEANLSYIAEFQASQRYIWRQINKPKPTKESYLGDGDTV